MGTVCSESHGAERGSAAKDGVWRRGIPGAHGVEPIQALRHALRGVCAVEEEAQSPCVDHLCPAREIALLEGLNKAHGNALSVNCEPLREALGMSENGTVKRRTVTTKSGGGVKKGKCKPSSEPRASACWRSCGAF